MRLLRYFNSRIQAAKSSLFGMAAVFAAKDSETEFSSAGNRGMISYGH